MKILLIALVGVLLLSTSVVNAQSDQSGLPDWLQNIIDSISSFFQRLFSGSGPLRNPQVNMINNTTVITVEVGPYPGFYGCEFVQLPWPGVNTKHVSCPYETPGAAINNAPDAFCKTAMGSQWAEAEICNEQGIILCLHPCETTPAHIKAQRCAFEAQRNRGNQAPPLDWCPPEDPVTPPPSGEGRPDNCDDTAYQAHPGYNGNEALWDGYAADTDGVCQTRFGTGVPSGPCAHTVQVSVGGNPYYLCFYNN